MATTYEPIATTTLSSAATGITFSSIPSTYTDLRLIFTGTVASDNIFRLRFNSDSGTNYSETHFYGNGSSIVNGRSTSGSYLELGDFLATNPNLATIDIFSYAGSTYKTLLLKHDSDQNGAGNTWLGVGLWRSTSAINTIYVYGFTNAFATGTTATLYGIKAA